MRHPFVPRAPVSRFDVVLAAALTALALVALTARPITGGGFIEVPGSTLLAVVLTLAMTVPAAWRRRYPLPVVGITGTVALATSLGAGGVTIGSFVAWWLLGSAALHTDRPTTVLLVLVGVPSVAGTVAFMGDEPQDLLAVVTAAAVGALPSVVGDALRRQRELTAEVLRLRATELEAAAREERVRIARDLHDTVGHHLGAIGLRARAGELDARDGDAAEAAGALAAVGRLADRALEDTRVLLGVLREDDGPGLRPTPGLGDLAELAGSAADAGVRVQLDGDAGELPDAISTCGYRIVQEALTNAAKHAAPTTARVEVRRSAERVRLTITDAGARPPRRDLKASNGGDHHRFTPLGAGGGGRGRGLTGMRERAHAVGGTVEAGPVADGGWRVHADLPDAL